MHNNPQEETSNHKNSNIAYLQGLSNVLIYITTNVKKSFQVHFNEAK